MSVQDSILYDHLFKELRVRQTNQRRARNLLGLKLRRLTPIGLLGCAQRGDALWLCRCDCGKFILCFASHMLAHGRRSCGSDRLPWQPCYMVSYHGLSSTKAYRIWASMLARCYNPNQMAYKRYGERGIKVDEHWHSFTNFYDDMGEPLDGMTLERKDNNQNYSKANCEWAGRKQQARNTSRNHVIVVNGESMCLAEAEERFGIASPKIRYRLKLGWTPEEAVGLVFKDRWGALAGRPRTRIRVYKTAE